MESKLLLPHRGKMIFVEGLRSLLRLQFGAPLWKQIPAHLCRGLSLSWEAGWAAKEFRWGGGVDPADPFLVQRWGRKSYWSFEWLDIIIRKIVFYTLNGQTDGFAYDVSQSGVRLMRIKIKWTVSVQIYTTFSKHCRSWAASVSWWFLSVWGSLASSSETAGFYEKVITQADLWLKVPWTSCCVKNFCILVPVLTAGCLYLSC